MVSPMMEKLKTLHSSISVFSAKAYTYFYGILEQFITYNKLFSFVHHQKRLNVFPTKIPAGHYTLHTQCQP